MAQPARRLKQHFSNRKLKLVSVTNNCQAVCIRCPICCTHVLRDLTRCTSFKRNGGQRSVGMPRTKLWFQKYSKLPVLGTKVTR